MCLCLCVYVYVCLVGMGLLYVCVCFVGVCVCSVCLCRPEIVFADLLSHTSFLLRELVYIPAHSASHLYVYA